jgi:hypothetical protein
MRGMYGKAIMLPSAWRTPCLRARLSGEPANGHACGGSCVMRQACFSRACEGAGTSLRVLTWCCVILLAVLSLLPAAEMTRTGLPGEIAHFVAYARSAAIAMAGYGARRGVARIIGGFWVYAGILEIPPALLARPAPSDRGFCGIGAWSAARRCCHRTSLAARVHLATLRVRPYG